MRVVVRLLGVLVLACLLASVEEQAGDDSRADAAFPGANGKIAFYTNRNIAHHDLYLMDANGANQTLVDTPPIYASTASPAWSPDGQHLAFTVATGGMTQVFVGDASGPTLVNVRNVSGTLSAATHLGWVRGPGQQKLAFARADGQILAADVDDPAATTPLTFDRPIAWPSWSPDGSTIAHTRLAGADGVPGIHLMDSDGSNIRQLTTESSDSFPDWSPDGSKIVFTRVTAQGELSVMVVNADGSGTPTPLISQPVQPYPAWSPDGTKIVFTDWIGGTTIISTMNPDGTGVQSLTNTVGFHDLQPAWQPLVPPIISGVEFTQGIQVLQSVSTLQSDLAADGKPPVPMIEGKPAAMRIYFAQVDQTTDYSVEVSGEFSDNEIVNLTPGCTPTQRRAQTGGCSSVDFFFTPPEDNWTVRLVVEDILNQVVLDEEFDLTSVYMGELDIEYLPVCVKMTPGASATCPTSIITGSGVTGLTEKLFPVAPHDFHYSRFPVPAIELAAPMTTYPQAEGLLAELRFRYNLMALGNLAPDQLAGWIPAGGHSQYLGLSDPIWFSSGQGRVTWQSDQSNSTDPMSPQFTLFHEVAHNYGARHPNRADACGATDTSTDWPYANATIQEVGFDVASGTAIPATNKDTLSYCTPPVSGTWISPHTYNKLVHSVFVPSGFGVSPAGAPIEQLVVMGSAQADGSAATIESAYVITTSTPVTPPNPLGNYCLRTSGGAVLDYCFMLRFQEHQSGAPTGSESFSVRIPLPAGTTRVSLAKGFLELDALELSASTPAVQLTEPDELQGEETIEWSGSDADGDALKYALMYTPDDGQTWYPIAVDLTEPEFTFDTSVLEGDEILIRVLASDGLNTTVETTGPVTVIHGVERVWGDNNCSGGADPVDALLTLRFDAGLSTNTGACPPFGQQVEITGGASFAWGDIDCSGVVAPVDALKLLRHDAALSVAQGPGCPQLGGGVQVLTAD